MKRIYIISLALLASITALAQAPADSTSQTAADTTTQTAADTLKTDAGIPLGDVIDEVIWIVGDDAILRSDVEKSILQMKFERSEVDGDPYCVIPEQLAVRKLFMHQAELDSVEANENNINMQVDQRMNEVIAQIGSEEKVAEYYGKSIKVLKEELREQAREQMKVQQVQHSIVSSNKITPSDVRKYWEKEAAEAELPIVPTKVEIELLAIEPRMSIKEVEDLKSKLREYKNRVENEDASFSMLATLYSDDMGSARNGGELGFMGKGQLVPEFANELFAMSDPKRLSRIVESEYGFHLIQFIERRGDKINCRHILLKPKISIEAKQKTKEKLDSIVTLLRTNKMTMEEAVAKYSTDKDTRNNAGLMENMKDGSSKFEYQALPADISRVAYNMNVGEFSEPFFMENSKGHQVCAVIRLKSKTEQHRASLEQDYQMMKAIVQEKKNQTTLENWIKKKQSETYTRISSDLKGCDWKYGNWNFSDK